MKEQKETTKSSSPHNDAMSLKDALQKPVNKMPFELIIGTNTPLADRDRYLIVRNYRRGMQSHGPSHRGKGHGNEYV